MYRKFGPKLVSIFMVYIQKNLIKKYTIFLKIYSILTAKMLLTKKRYMKLNGIIIDILVKRTENRVLNYIQVRYKAILHNSTLSYKIYAIYFVKSIEVDIVGRNGFAEAPVLENQFKAYTFSQSGIQFLVPYGTPLF